MGKCKFNNSWLEKSTFSAWLRRVEGNVFLAACSLCRKTLRLGTLGVKALESHARSGKHQTQVKNRQEMHVVSSVFNLPASGASSVSDVVLAIVPQSAAPAPAASGIIHLATATLKAEVLWTLHTVTNHQSYNSNEGMGELFRAMFPDSDIAKTFSCGGDKTSYVTLFGLAEHIKRELGVEKSGFSVDKKVETFNNMQEDTVVAQRLVCAYVTQYGGVTKVPLTEELLDSVASARYRYRAHLDEERRKKESGAQGQKRKTAEDHLEDLKKRWTTILAVSEVLARDADRFAEEAEDSIGSKMAELISKSNILRRGHKEKLVELETIEKEIVAKGAELETKASS